MDTFEEKRERRSLARRLWNIKEPNARPLLSKDAPPMDLLLFFTVLALALFGTAMVFSAGYAYAEVRYDDSLYFIKRQTVFLTIGILGMLLLCRVSISFIERITPLLYLLTLALLILVLMIGLVGNGAKRWISLGPITIQPSEIAKVTMVLMMARYFTAFEPLALEKK